MRILVTGGAGFIGSHTVVELQQAGYDVVVLDNLCNASEKVIPRVEAITGKKVPFYKADILDREALEEIFSKEQIDAVIHFAGLKAVGESVQKPWEYYENNIAGTLTLVDVMRKHGVKSIIFSSSATVYGNPAFVPITEECPKGTVHQPLRLDEIYAGADPDGYPEGRSRMECDPASLLQPYRSSQERYHWRESQRYPQQPDALYHTGSSRQAERAGCLR